MPEKDAVVSLNIQDASQPIENANQTTQQQAPPPPSLSSFGALNIAATEFRPTFSTSSSMPASMPASTSSGTNTTSHDGIQAHFASLSLGNNEQYQQDYYNRESSSLYDTNGEYDYPYEDDWGYTTSTSLSQQPEYSEEDVGAFLRDQFPGYSQAALVDVYRQCGESLDKTVSTLFHLETELSGQFSAPEFSSSYYGGGGGSGTAASSEQPKEAQFSNDDFPTLGGGGGGDSSVGAGGGVAKSNSTTSNKAMPYGGSYAGKAKAARHLPAPPAVVASNSTSGGGNNSSAAAAAAPVWESAETVHRFSTGETAAAEYADARAQARDLALLRNRCFEQATQAFLQNNKALAKNLGAQGREYNRQMHEAHAAASAEIFARRNAAVIRGGDGSGEATQLAGDGSVPTTIDLHGLHVTEAIRLLEDVIGRLQLRRVPRVRVVVGVGTHGKVPSKMPKAVRSTLDEWGLQYKERYAGLLEVSLL